MSTRLTTVAITVALLFLAGACTSDGDDTADTTPVSSPTTAAQEEPSSFDGELVTIVTPGGWTATEHDERDGVTVQGPDVTVEVTAIPSVLFGPVFLELPTPTEPEVLAELVAPALGPSDGVDKGEVEIVALDGGLRAVTISASGPDGEGEVIVFDLGGGTIAVATAQTEPGLYSEVREAVRSTVASFTLNASVDDLLAAMDPPPELTGN